MTQTLQYRRHHLANKSEQQALLTAASSNKTKLPAFQEKISAAGSYPLKPDRIEIFQVNLGYLCNQTCKHCHVDAGPDRKELMERKTMDICLELCRKNQIKTLDITGGAPEMHPHFRWFVQEARRLELSEVIVRSNLTIIVSHPRYADLPEFFQENGVRLISSLPFYRPERTDRQRGKGVFQKSIEALQKLNAVGYGKDDNDLRLDLVYNPSGAFLPASQKQLEKEFKQELKENFGIDFHQLFTITNLPISRFLEFLIESKNYEEYMERLVYSFNPATLKSLMCRNTLSIDYQGYIYDCDFNQMLGLRLDPKVCQHVKDFDLKQLERRTISINQHCYGCTAGAGSSCQGTVA